MKRKVKYIGEILLLLVSLVGGEARIFPPHPLAIEDHPSPFHVPSKPGSVLLSRWGIKP